MSNELLSLSIKGVWINWLLFAIIPLPLFITMMIFSNIAIAYKLALLTIISIWLLLLAYQFLFNIPKKVDLLFALQNAIVWENNRTELYDIVRLSSLSYFFTILGIKKSTQKTKYILISANSIPITQYKALRRYIKWQPTSSN